MTAPTHCRNTAAVLALALLAACAPAAAESLLVVDIARASAADVDALKRSPDAGWWLELGTQLVLVGAERADVARASSATVVESRDNVDTTHLMLRARGCSEHSTPHGRLLAQGGRWELREVSARDMPVLLREPAHAWQPATPGMTVARQHRLDRAGHGVMPAEPAVQSVVDRIDAVRWFADVVTLADWDRSSYGTQDLAEARDWIADAFAALGLATSTPAFTMMQPGAGQISRNNVLGVWTGTTQPDRWLVVGAHYDSRNASPGNAANTPGAEDNATGCAGVIELARALLPSQPRRSILFMCYAGEEQGLLGSKAHVQSLTGNGDLARIELAVIMDMIGYSADAHPDVLFETGATHTAALQRFTDAAATYVPSLGVITSTMPFGSDHVPYLDAGVPAVLSIENDWDVYPHYHSVSDTPDNIGPHALAMGAAILKTNAAVIADVAGLHVAPFADGFEDAPATQDAAQLPGVVPLSGAPPNRPMNLR